MLEWFVSSANVGKAHAGDLIDEEMVETIPEKIPNCITDENVNIFHIRKYFTVDAWKVVCQVLDVKRGQTVWSCQVCDMDVEDESVACDCCLNWFHFVCAGLRSAPKRKEWFCRSCYAKY